MKRYYAVVCKRAASKVHRMFSDTHAESNLTVCGRKVAKGWIWSTREMIGKPRCERCYT